MKRIIGITIAVLILGVAEFSFGAWMYQTAAIDKMRDAAIQELNTMVSLDDYSPKNQERVKSILQDSTQQIMETTEEREVSNIKRDTKNELESIETLSQIRKAGYSKLKKSVNLDKYRKAQRKQVRSILDQSKKEIYRCVTKKEIKNVSKNAKERISKIKTNAQLTKEEEEKARQEELERQRIAEAAAAAARAEAEKEAKEKAKAEKEAKKSGSNKKKD